ncbi:hypothetical protein [Spirilliplanes yamanashiensis]|uniref:Uncharacterized protein n=1 Tax=Spirilliplanes yamanashiensis TaxID=42233 RepID=A0A8J3Y6I0_9ACTN|nr:hypothetical protein [Spirilliplanes yamanashiensis]MDP9815031.1 hypothetical protein [Spirilliplanes yamanashiensis]GIJ02688.1 hypothetical protein Sya03_20400 [Spirilliplanes yamanashiensis]
MLHADVDAFSDAVTPLIDGITGWRAGSAMRELGDLIHMSLSDALHQEPLQASLRLIGQDAAAIGPAIQYVGTGFAESAFGLHVQADAPNAVMRSGRLAFQWVPANETDAIQVRFRELARLVWEALHAVTTSVLVTPAGTPVRNVRIGSVAKQWALKHPGQLLSDWGRPVQVDSRS